MDFQLPIIRLLGHWNSTTPTLWYKVLEYTLAVL